MKSSDDGGDVRLAGELLRLPHDVDDPGVTTSGEDNQAATGDSHHDRPVIED
jgi:hypothetical protein